LYIVSIKNDPEGENGWKRREKGGGKANAHPIFLEGGGGAKLGESGEKGGEGRLS